MALTGVRDVDIEILLFVDEISVGHLATVCKTLHELVRSDEYCCRKIIRTYGSSVVLFKPERDTFAQQWAYLNDRHLDFSKQPVKDGRLDKALVMKRSDLYTTWKYHKLLKIYFELNKHVSHIQGTIAANLAVKWNHREALEFLETRGHLPDSRGANEALENDRYELLYWMEARGVLPDKNAYWKSYWCNKRLGWLFERKVLPDVEHANFAASIGHITALKAFESKGIFPDSSGADMAISNAMISTLGWLIDRKILPSQNGVDMAARKGLVTVLKMLKEHGLTLSPSGVELARKNNRHSVIRYLDRLL